MQDAVQLMVTAGNGVAVTRDYGRQGADINAELVEAIEFDR